MIYEDMKNFSTTPSVFCHLLEMTHALNKQTLTVYKHRNKTFLSLNVKPYFHEVCK
jgi:hypothetical protein